MATHRQLRSSPQLTSFNLLIQQMKDPRLCSMLAQISRNSHKLRVTYNRSQTSEDMLPPR